jgi:hypothetical protein
MAKVEQIGIIGNCQTLGLAILLHEIVDPIKYRIAWICYGEKFIPHLNSWTKAEPQRTAYKCPVYIEETESELALLKSDFLIYHKILPQTSPRYHYKRLEQSGINKLSISNIHIDECNYDYTYKRMKSGEENLGVDYCLADFIHENRRKHDILLTPLHPTTLFYKWIIKGIVQHFHFDIDLSILEERKYGKRNYLEMPD